MDSGQQIVCVGIACRQGKVCVRGCCRRSHPVHFIVGIGSLGGVCVLRVPDPIQHIGVYIVIVDGGFAQGIGGFHQPVAVLRVGGGGGDLALAVYDGHGGVVAPGIVGEFIDLTLCGGGLCYVVIAVVFVGQLCAGG